MIRYSKLPDNIISLLPEAINYLHSREDVFFAYLFGSLVKGKIAPLSDVDIAVYLSEEKGLDIKKLEILGGLIECLQTDEIDETIIVGILKKDLKDFIKFKDAVINILDN